MLFLPSHAFAVPCPLPLRVCSFKIVRGCFGNTSAPSPFSRARDSALIQGKRGVRDSAAGEMVACARRPQPAGPRSRSGLQLPVGDGGAAESPSLRKPLGIALRAGSSSPRAALAFATCRQAGRQSPGRFRPCAVCPSRAPPGLASRSSVGVCSARSRGDPRRLGAQRLRAGASVVSASLGPPAATLEPGSCFFGGTTRGEGSLSRH